jgi:hypothetical protein
LKNGGRSCGRHPPFFLDPTAPPDNSPKSSLFRNMRNFTDGNSVFPPFKKSSVNPKLSEEPQ